MDINKIPPHIKQILNDKHMNMNQKLIAFTCFMPRLPDTDPETMNIINANIEIGKQIKNLINSKKIEINGWDSDFNLNIIEK